MEAKKTSNYYVLDSRAGNIAILNDGNLICDDPTKYILEVGTLKECCKSVNRKDYGDFCIISDDEFNIQWELCNKSGHWTTKTVKQHEK